MARTNACPRFIDLQTQNCRLPTIPLTYYSPRINRKAGHAGPPQDVLGSATRDDRPSASGASRVSAYAAATASSATATDSYAPGNLLLLGFLYCLHCDTITKFWYHFVKKLFFSHSKVIQFYFQMPGVSIGHFNATHFISYPKLLSPKMYFYILS